MFSLGTAHGITETLLFDDAEGTATIKRTADVEPIIDANKRAQADGAGWSPSREWVHVARLDPIIVDIWRKQWGVDPLHPAHRDLLDRLINDLDNRYLRVAEGHI